MATISAKYYLKENAKIKDYFVAIIALVICIGLYQSYICVTLGIMLFEYIRKLERINDLKVFFRDAFTKIFVVGIGGGLYYLVWKVVLIIFDISSQNYYGADDVASSSDMLYALIRTYKNVAIYFRRPFLYATGSGTTVQLIEYIGVLANVVLIGYILIALIYRNLSDKKVGKVLLQLFLISIIPFAINVACFLAKGDEHSLMQYGTSMIYVFAAVLLDKEYLLSLKLCNKIHFNTRRVYMILYSPFIIIIWINVVFANQMYMKKVLQEESAKYEMSKMVQRIEALDDYRRGETKVILVGYINDNEYFSDLEQLNIIQGVGVYDTVFSYSRTVGEYINFIMNANMNLYIESTDSRLIKVGEDASVEDNWKDSEIPYGITKELSIYPDDNSVVMIDGVVIVRLSEADTIW